MTTSNLKVAVVAANGGTGQLIVSEALGRGLDAAGASTVSYADYAIAIVDLAESGEHVCERVSVVSK